MHHLKKIGLACLSTLLLASTPAFALGGYVGGGLGVSKLTTSGADLGASVAANVGFLFAEKFGLGLDIQTYTYSADTSLGDVTYNLIPFTLAGTYHFMSVANGPYVGALVGFAQHSVEVLGYEVHKTVFAAGGHAGYNFPLTERLGLGPRFSFIHAFKSSGGTTEVDDTNFWSLGANIVFTW